MPNTVTVEDAKTRLDDLIDRAHRGEEWLITCPDGQPVAKLALVVPEPAPTRKRWEAFGMMKGQIEFLPGYDDPLEEFEAYS